MGIWKCLSCEFVTYSSSLFIYIFNEVWFASSPGTQMNKLNLKAKIATELLHLNTGSKALG